METKSELKFKQLCLCIVILLLSIPLNVSAQCVSNNATGNCSGGNGEITDNANLNRGNKYWWSGGTTTISNINFGGGTLVICGGDLTINNGNLNGGMIIVMGGTLRMNFNCTLNGTFTLVNYSKINFNNGLSLQGNGAQLFNNGGIVNVDGQTSISNTSQIVNGGQFETDNLLIQTSGSAPALCQGASSTVAIRSNFTNNTRYSIRSPEGQSCISVGGNTSLNQDVSPDAALQVCDGTSGSSSRWGAATVLPGCTDCSSVLPVELVYFKVIPENQHMVKLEWQTASEMNSEFFTVERSINGTDWEAVTTLDGAGTSHAVITYSAVDRAPYDGLSYYRLKETDFDGFFEYSDTKVVNFEHKQAIAEVEIYPNPTSATITIKASEEELQNVRIYNSLGQDVTYLTGQSSATINSVTKDIRRLATGFYTIRTLTTAKTVYKN